MSKNLKQSVITIGTFDGVHKGHQVILSKVAEIAKKNNLKSIVLSFENPVKQVSGLITTTEEKVNLLASFCVDEILRSFIKPFTFLRVVLIPIDCNLTIILLAPKRFSLFKNISIILDLMYSSLI